MIPYSQQLYYPSELYLDSRLVVLQYIGRLESLMGAVSSDGASFPCICACSEEKSRLDHFTQWVVLCWEVQMVHVLFCFSLSKLQLKTGDLDPRLFSRLRHLQKLDLSDNLLDKFPNSLTLPDLRVLNCNNNKLEDVTALKQFPLLEELTYENNVYLTVSYLTSLQS